MIWIGRLISIAVWLQTVEMFWIPTFRAERLIQEFPRGLKWILRFDRSLLVLRLLVAGVALIIPSAPAVLVLLLTTWMIAVRWRGTFNGGSDIMTFHILAAWFVSLCWPSLSQACVYYIAIQLILSFAVAGVAKVANPEWRNGSALGTFLERSGYVLPSSANLALSWSVLIFEILFPLVVFMPWTVLAGAIVFQLANAYVFGLNRFFFAWLAGYPAILILAHASN